jgi:CDP-paratose 2-epimerase
MRVLVTGSNGLIGSEAVAYFDSLGADVIGVDNNMRAVFFGKDGDTRWNQHRLESEMKRFTHRELDIRDREAVLRTVADEAPDLIVHCAAQPSHDLAAKMPFEDFDVNAVGTMNLLEALRRHRPEAVFVLTSTNKVYGDAPNERPLKELETRWEYADEADYHGIDEHCRIDHICYISDLRKFKAHYPGWDVEISLREIIRQLIASWKTRRPDSSPKAEV